MAWKAIGFEQKNLDELPLAAMNPFRIIEGNGKIGVEHYFTLKRRIIIPTEYDYIEQVYVKAGIFFIVGVNKKYGVYNSEGKLIIQVMYNKIYIQDKIIVTRINRYRGAYDFDGNHIVPDKYLILKCYDDIIKVETFSYKYGVYDYQGNHIVPNSFIECNLVKFNIGYEEFIFVKDKHGDVGLYNKKGQEIVPLKGYTQLTICKKFIIANTSSSNFTSTVYSYDGTVILPRIEHGYHSWNGVAIYYFDNGIKVCDENGKEFEPGKVYESIYAMHDEFLAVKLEGQWKVLCNM